MDFRGEASGDKNALRDLISYMQAAAALYTMLLRERAAAGHSDLPDGILPTCTAIATPACATQDLATGCSSYVTSLVCQVSHS